MPTSTKCWDENYESYTNVLELWITIKHWNIGLSWILFKVQCPFIQGRSSQVIIIIVPGNMDNTHYDQHWEEFSLDFFYVFNIFQTRHLRVRGIMFGFLLFSAFSKCGLSGFRATIQYFKGLCLPLSQSCFSHQIPHLKIKKKNVHSIT